MPGDIGAIKDGLLAALAAVAVQRRSFDEAEQNVVEAARTAGATWDEIGDCYSISRQAAQKRFRQPRAHHAGR